MPSGTTRLRAPTTIVAPILAALAALVGLVLLGGGAWLAALGGSWYYALAGLGFLATAALLAARRWAALEAFALVVAGTLLWSLWEVGPDWWPLAARGGGVFVLGLALLTPWATRGWDRAPAARTRGLTRATTARLGLGAALAAALAVAGVSWFVDPERIAGTAPAARAAPGPDGVPPGEWWAYGRTAAGQRYAPLDQITPQNVAALAVAWTARTGDAAGPGDPKETTFEVTPLKIGDRLFLCTPHQAVIALDATTGAEIWRFDPRIRGRLALQHLTCRGLSYWPGDATAPAATDGAATQGAAAPGGGGAPADAAPPPPGSAVPDLPVAAQGARVVAHCGARLLMPTADGRVIALDPDSGGVCGDFGHGTGQIDLWRNMPFARPGGYYSTSPVVVTRRLVIVGGTVLDNVSVHETSGVIRAFDVQTGDLVWNFDSGNPDATEPIAADARYTPGSPNSWSIASVDETLGLVYLPFGNQPPDQWGAQRSPAVERFSSSVVALDLASGRVRWSFQTVHHDLWDYDVPAQPTLVDLRLGGTTVPALVQPTKQGDIYVLDRRTGAPLLPVREQPAPQGAVAGDRTAPTQPASALSFAPPPLAGRDMWGVTMLDQMACRIQLHRLRYEGRFTPPSTAGSVIYPGNFGVFNWGGVAVDPARGIAFATPARLAFVSRLVRRPDDTTPIVQGPDRGDRSRDLPALNENFGAPYAVQLVPFLSLLGLPCQAPPWGFVAAADLATGRTLWMHRNGTVRDLAPVPLPLRLGVPSLGGPLLTAGGVAFLSGTLDDYVRAYDVSDGRQLWEARLPAGGQATPMSYRGRDGRQYVLVVAGGHGSLGTRTGDYVIAYALPR